MRLVIALAIVAVLGIGTAFLSGKLVQRERAQRETLIMFDSYQRGFMAGVNATTSHLQFDTNAGKFTLEMSNVLADMDKGYSNLLNPRIIAATNLYEASVHTN